MTEIVTEFRVIRLSDGEERQADPDPQGAWSCPWCGGVNQPGTDFYESRGWEYPCANPACVAGGRGSPEQVAAVKLEWQRQAEAAGRRAWLAVAQEDQREKREQARQAAVQEFTALAAEHGYCAGCWARSTSHGLFPDRPKLISHRKAANCPLAKRRRQP